MNDNHEPGVLIMSANHIGDPARAGVIAQQIIAILVHEDSLTRQRAINAAMMLLGEAAPKQTNFEHDNDEHLRDNSADLVTFFNRSDDLDPADNAHLCAAFHYSIYGAAPFSIAELKAIAADAGVVIPDRTDMTMRNATYKGKKLFQSAGKGSFRPTAAGSLAFSEKWSVKPGRKAKPSAALKGNGGTDAKT